MIDLVAWLNSTPGHRYVPLFKETDSLIVSTKLQGERRLLERSEEMERAVIELVEAGIDDPTWEGLLYVMGWGQPKEFRILYVGKAERKGVRNTISANLLNIRRNKHKFARWGNGIAYHIGDLSQALFGFQAYKKPSPKYLRWVEALFSNYDSPTLEERVYLYLIPWYQDSIAPSSLLASLPAVEKEVIALAGVQFKETILNMDGI